jgi:hypothetical protein
MLLLSGHHGDCHPIISRYILLYPVVCPQLFCQIAHLQRMEIRGGVSWCYTSNDLAIWASKFSRSNFSYLNWRYRPFFNIFQAYYRLNFSGFYGFVLYSTSTLGSWNDHWWHVLYWHWHPIHTYCGWLYIYNVTSLLFFVAYLLPSGKSR